MKPPDDARLIWQRLAGRPESLAPFRTFVLGRARAAALSDQVQARIDLVLEEVLLNVFHYAFAAGQTGEVAVGCGLVPEQGFLVRVSDPGRPFDPLGRPPPDTSLDIADRQVGGLGILLAREMSGAMVYRRRNDRNVLDIYFPAQ